MASDNKDLNGEKRIRMVYIFQCHKLYDVSGCRGDYSPMILVSFLLLLTDCTT